MDVKTLEGIYDHVVELRSAEEGMAAAVARMQAAQTAIAKDMSFLEESADTPVVRAAYKAIGDAKNPGDAVILFRQAIQAAAEK